MFEISISNFIYICINLNNLEYNSWPGHFFETQHRLSFGYRCKFESNLRKGLFLQMPLQQTQKNSSGHAQWQTCDALGKQPYLAAPYRLTVKLVRNLFAPIPRRSLRNEIKLTVVHVCELLSITNPFGSFMLRVTFTMLFSTCSGFWQAFLLEQNYQVLSIYIKPMLLPKTWSQMRKWWSTPIWQQQFMANKKTRPACLYSFVQNHPISSYQHLPKGH